jgi:hypothetical protein
MILAMVLFPTAAYSDPLPLPPYYEDIMKVIEPLQYSGVQVMVKPQVNLTIDFTHWRWTLHNIHEYDNHGGIILEEGRFGLCAELATYLFEKIRPILDDSYDLKFAKVTESSFFPTEDSNHIVLLLADKATKQIYILDPSFHVYGRAKDLAGYRVLDIQDTLSFIKDQSHDVSFGANQATPLYIKNDILLSFAVTSIDGKFDRDNFIFVISANRRSKSRSRDIVIIGRRNKEFQDFQDKAILEQLLTPAEINTLFEKLKSWIRQV